MTSFPCCSSQALEPSLKNKLPIPHQQGLHLLDHLWKQLRGFSLHHPGATGFTGGLLEGQAPGKPAWSFLLGRETAQVGTHPWPCLPDRQTDTSQGLLCADSYKQKSFFSKFGFSVESGTLTAVGKCAEKLGGSCIPVFAHEQLWIASHFSIVPMGSFFSMVLTWEQAMFQ